MIGAFQSGVLISGSVAAPLTYATFDPTKKHADITLSNGNLSATRNGAAWRSAFFDITKSSGLWAIEVSQSTSGTGNRYSLTGMDSDVTGTLATYIASDNYGVSASYGTIGYDIRDGNLLPAFFTVNTTAGYKELIVLDFTNKRVLANKAGVLTAGRASAGAGPFEPGVSMYTDLSTVFTINTGQSAFTAENLSLMSAYETANSVTINRGLWT